MGLLDINMRWHDTGHPHAIFDEGTRRWHSHCPRCGTTSEDGHADELGAMSDAIAHKNRCAQLQ